MTSSAVAMIDHALLHPTMTDDEIRAGCELCLELEVASVCVKPSFIPLASEIVGGSKVSVSTVIGFPQGGNTSDVKAFETKVACEMGAVEVDMVVNIGKVLSGDWDYVEWDIRGVVDMAHSHGAITKVIFETDYLTSRQDKIRLCEVCTQAGAEFVKTSTGFGFVKQADGQLSARGATLDDVQLMKQHVGELVQVKASGGIRSYEDAIKMIEAGATRLGTSASRAIADGQAAAPDSDY